MAAVPPTVDGVLLLGWMEKDEAIYWLVNECYFDPPLTEQQAIEIWEKYKKAVEALPERTPQKPQQVAIAPSIQPIVHNFIARTRGSEVIGVLNINPLGLLVYQLYVV